MTFRDLIEKIKEFGHPVNMEGMCFGVALMGLQAILLKDTITLQKRLELLSKIPKGKLLEELGIAERHRVELQDKARQTLQADIKWQKEVKFPDEKIFEKRLSHDARYAYYQALNLEAEKNLTERERILLSIPAYLEGIAIYFQPDLYPQLFEKKYSIILADDEDERKPEVGQIILTLNEDNSLSCKILGKKVIISKDIIEKELKKEDVQTFYDILKSKDPGRLKPFTDNITDILSKIDPIFKQDPRPKMQDAVLTFPRVLPAALMEQKTNNISTPLVQKITAWCGLYDRDELTSYLDILEANLVANGLSEPVAFLLSSSNHSITISFDSKSLPPQWRLVDANRLSLLDHEQMTTDKLAEQIIDGFSKNGTATFSTEVYATHATVEQVQSTISDCQKDMLWQEMHAVKLEKLNKEDSFHGSWLFIAARSNDFEFVKLLLQSKAVVDLAVSDGSTPLLAGIQNGNIKIVKCLLEEKASVNLARKDGVTPFLTAIQVENLEIVKHLLEKKANIDMAPNGMTPLHLAVASGSVEIVKHLLEVKAKVDVVVMDRITPLYLAVEQGHDAIVNLLLDQKGISYEKSTIQASVDVLMSVAMMKGRKAQVEELFRKKGITIMQNMLENFSPLHAAAFFGHLETAKVLLSKAKADPNAVTENNISALEFAEAMGHTAIFELLNNEIIVSKKKDESPKQPFFEMKGEAKSAPDYLLLQARLTKIEKINDSSEELVLLKKIIRVYEDAQGKLPITKCLDIVIQDSEMRRIHQTLAKNDGNLIEVIKKSM